MTGAANLIGPSRVSLRKILQALRAAPADLLADATPPAG